MVNFSVFNELSIPFDPYDDVEKKFQLFFKVLSELAKKDLKKIRMDQDFKNYEIVNGILLQQFLGSINNNTLRLRIKEFIANRVIEIESPLINDDEDIESEIFIKNNYSFEGEPNYGGLACGDIWNTLVVSFDSNSRWNTNVVQLSKNNTVVDVKHVSQLQHLYTHTLFFNALEIENQQNINQKTFWQDKEKYFTTKIFFCKEVEKQIKHLDIRIFQQAVGILRDIETGKKIPTDFKCSGESDSVKSNDDLKKLRMFTIDDEKVYFDNHIKFSSYRIYYFEKNRQIYIGYIGKHLPTKNF